MPDQTPPVDLDALAKQHGGSVVDLDALAGQHGGALVNVGTPAGLIEPGTVDLVNQPKVQNPDGTMSTVLSFSIEADGKHVLLPRVDPENIGRILSEDEAVQRWRDTDDHLGIFDSEANATAYAKQLHEAYAAHQISRLPPLQAQGVTQPPISAKNAAPGTTFTGSGPAALLNAMLSGQMTPEELETIAGSPATRAQLGTPPTRTPAAPPEPDTPMEARSLAEQLTASSEMARRAEQQQGIVTPGQPGLGPANLIEGLAGLLKDAATPATANQPDQRAPAGRFTGLQGKRSPIPDKTLQKATQAITGAFQTSTPLLALAGVAAPLRTTLNVGLALAASAGGAELVKLSGGSPAEQDFAGAISALVVGSHLGAEALDVLGRGGLAAIQATGRAATPIALAGKLSGKAVGGWRPRGAGASIEQAAVRPGVHAPLDVVETGTPSSVTPPANARPPETIAEALRDSPLADAIRRATPDLAITGDELDALIRQYAGMADQATFLGDRYPPAQVELFKQLAKKFGVSRATTTTRAPAPAPQARPPVTYDAGTDQYSVAVPPPGAAAPPESPDAFTADLEALAQKHGGTVEPAPTPPTTEGSTVGVPFMVTRKMEADLRGLGFSPAEINGMTPADAWQYLQAGARPGASATAATPTTTEPQPPVPPPTAAPAPPAPTPPPTPTPLPTKGPLAWKGAVVTALRGPNGAKVFEQIVGHPPQRGRLTPHQVAATLEHKGGSKWTDAARRVGEQLLAAQQPPAPTTTEPEIPGEPKVGDRVRWGSGTVQHEGEVRRVVTAGKPGGTGINRERRRVQVRFLDAHSGRYLETHVDVSDVTIVPPAGTEIVPEGTKNIPEGAAPVPAPAETTTTGKGPVSSPPAETGTTSEFERIFTKVDHRKVGGGRPPAAKTSPADETTWKGRLGQYPITFRIRPRPITEGEQFLTSSNMRLRSTKVGEGGFFLDVAVLGRKLTTEERAELARLVGDADSQKRPVLVRMAGEPFRSGHVGGQITPTTPAPPPAETGAGNKPAIPPVTKSEAPAGDNENAEPEAADTEGVTYFRSGATRPADFDGLADAKVPIGVTATELTPEMVKRVVAYVNGGGTVMVDSGAFSGKVDFDKVLLRYAELETKILPDAAPRLYLVAPDVVGNQTASLNLLHKHEEAVKRLMEGGARLIVPLQKATNKEDYSLGEMMGAIRTRFGSRVIAGIPFNKAAYTVADVVQGLKAAVLVPDVHLLGIGARNKAYEAAVTSIRSAGQHQRTEDKARAFELSSDSNRVAAMFGKGRPAQDAVDHKVETRAPERVDADANADTTELTNHFWNNRPTMFTPPELARLGQWFHVSSRDLVTAMGSRELLQRLVDAAGGDQVVDLAIQDVALLRAKKTEGPVARRETITEQETPGTKPKATGWAHERMPPDRIFPAPDQTVHPAVPANTSEMLSPEAAAARVAEWKAEAKRIGREEDHSNDVILSLFDRTGAWSQPYVDAGYDVRRYDAENGDDLVAFLPTADIDEIKRSGKRIVGVLAAPPCTSYAVSGARWWKDQHDKADVEMVEKKYGFFASKYFDTPLDYANTLVAVTQVVIELANPTAFHVLENPIGRIAQQNDLPKPLLVFDPSNYGSPYTKKTQLWGRFNPNLPTANVLPSKGSYIHVLRGDDPVQKLERSVTPEGFAYAFFMANHGLAAAKSAATLNAPKEPDDAAARTTILGTSYETEEELAAKLGPITAPNVTLSDVPRDLANRAHAGLSWTPERRGAMEQREYVRHMQAVWVDLEKRAKTPEQQEKARTEFERYRQLYLARFKDYLSSMSRLLSVNVAGPSNFPARRQQKRSDAHSKKLREFLEWDRTAQHRLVQAVDPTAPHAISADRDDAVEALQAKIAAAEKLQDVMRQANRIIRQKTTDEQKVAAMVKLGLSEKVARKALQKDYMGRVGFPAYEFQNNLANIRRMQERVEQITKLRATPERKATFPATDAHPGGYVEENAADNRVQIFFDSKPNEAFRSKLKGHGFKWAPSVGAWQRQRSENAEYAVRNVLGVRLDTPREEATSAETGAGDVAQRGVPERHEADGGGLQPEAGGTDRGEEGDADRDDTRTPEEAGLDDLIAAAQAGGYTGDVAVLRRELEGRLQCLKDIDADFSAQGRDPIALLKAIAKGGGLSIERETEDKGELRWLKEFQDTRPSRAKRPRGNLAPHPFVSGQINGVRGVLRRDGRTLDGMVEYLREEPQFRYIDQINTLIDELRNAATAQQPRLAIDTLADSLGERWWETIGVARVAPEDEPVSDSIEPEGDVDTSFDFHDEQPTGDAQEFDAATLTDDELRGWMDDGGIYAREAEAELARRQRSQDHPAITFTKRVLKTALGRGDQSHADAVLDFLRRLESGRPPGSEHSFAVPHLKGAQFLWFKRGGADEHYEPLEPTALVRITIENDVDPDAGRYYGAKILETYGPDAYRDQRFNENLLKDGSAQLALTADWNYLAVPTGADYNQFGEAQPRLPEAGLVRDEDKPTPEFDAPFALESEVGKRKREQEGDLFAGNLEDLDAGLSPEELKAADRRRRNEAKRREDQAPLLEAGGALPEIPSAEAYAADTKARDKAFREKLAAGDEKRRQHIAIFEQALLERGTTADRIAEWKAYVAAKLPPDPVYLADYLWQKLRAIDPTFPYPGDDPMKPALLREPTGDELAPVFYSQLARVIEQKVPVKASAAQILTTVKNPQHGVRSDELKWSGLEAWLAGRKGPIARDEVLQFLAANRLQIGETWKDQAGAQGLGSRYHRSQLNLPGGTNYREVLLTLAPGFQSPEGRERLAKRQAIFDQYRPQLDELDRQILAGMGTPAPDGLDYGGIGDRALDRLRREREILETQMEEEADAATLVLAKQRVVPDGNGWYWDLTFDGEQPGTNMNGGVVRWEGSGWEVSDRAFPDRHGIRGGFRASFQSHFKTFDTLEDAIGWAQAKQREVLRHRARQETFSSFEIFRTGHWDEGNVLLHVRLNDRTDEKGRRVLFLEEIQSDWHERGRKYGYRQPQQARTLDQIDADISAVMAALNDRLRDAVPDYDTLPLRARSEAYTAAWQDHPDLRAKLLALHQERDAFRGQSPDAVPDAPYRTTWHELAVKRMLRYAAEHGYDALAWTTGDQQNDRYNLRKYASRVVWVRHVARDERRPGENGWTRIEASSGSLMAFDTGGMPVVEEHDVEQAQLAHYLGRELADRLIASGVQPVRVVTRDHYSTETGLVVPRQYSRYRYVVVQGSNVLAAFPSRVAAEDYTRSLNEPETAEQIDQKIVEFLRDFGRRVGHRFVDEDGTFLVTDPHFTQALREHPADEETYDGLLREQREASWRNPTPNRYELAGADLEIGGKGMRGFYDEILPRFLNKYAKPWGAHVETIPLRYIVDDLTIRRFATDPVTDDDHHVYWGLWSDEHEDWATDTDGSILAYRSQAEAAAGLERYGHRPGPAVHGVVVTPAMRTSVLEAGQPQFVRTEDGNIRIGWGDEETGAMILARGIYQHGATATIIAKETVQNAFDAVRPLGADGHVTIRFHHAEADGTPPVIEVHDNGPGLTREEIDTDFTDLFESGKRALQTGSGEFGVGKAAYLLGGQQVEVETVAVTGVDRAFLGRRTPKKTRYRFTATPAEFFAKKGVHVDEEPVSSGTPTGTTVRTTLKVDARGLSGQMYHAELFATHVAQRAVPTLPGTYEFTQIYGNQPPSAPDVRSTPKDRDAAVDGYRRLTFSLTGGNVTVYLSPKIETGNAVRLWVANKGIYQLASHFGTTNPHVFELVGPKLDLPAEWRVDVHATVKGDDERYPFMLNRETLKPDFATELRIALYEAVVKPLRDKLDTLTLSTYRQIPTLKARPDVAVWDSGKRLTDAERETLLSSPGVLRVIDANMALLRAMLAKLEIPTSGPEAVERLGVLLAATTHGVLFGDPAGGVRDGTNRPKLATILLNIFSHAEADPVPEMLAAAMYHTAAHEITHWWVGDEKTNGQAFTARFAWVWRKLGGHFEQHWLKVLEAAYGEPGHADARLNADLARALPVYTASRGRPVVEEDLLSGASSHLDRPTDERGAEGVSPADDRSARSRTVSRAQLRALADRLATPLETQRARAEAAGYTIVDDDASEPIAQINLIPGGKQFVTEDVLPTLAQAARGFAEAGTQLRQGVAPASIGTGRIAAGTLRAMMGREAQENAKMRDAALEFQRVFDRLIKTTAGRQQAVAWWDAVQTGQETAILPELRPAYEFMRAELDDLRDLVQEFGKLEHFNQFYFPQIWKFPKEEMRWIQRKLAGLLNRRPFEGSKSFLKHRTYPTFREGLDALTPKGVQPISWNPVDHFEIKMREMRRYVVARRAIAEWRAMGLWKTFPVHKLHTVPEGWVRVEGPLGTVYGPPTIQVKEAFDPSLLEGLEHLLRELGVKVDRKGEIGGKRWGYAVADKQVVTKAGGPEGVLMHELGHILDERYGLWNRVVSPAPRRAHTITRGKRKGQVITRAETQDQATVRRRVTIKNELRALADLRFEGQKDPRPGFKDYVRQEDEKMANLVHAFLYAPERAKEVAPNAYWVVYNLAKDTPELKPLLELQKTRSLKLGVRAHEYALGGFPILAYHYLPADAARVFNNYLSTGLAGRSAIYDAYRTWNNTMVSFQLAAAGLFHATFTGLDALYSEGGLLLQELARAAETKNPKLIGQALKRGARLTGMATVGAAAGLAISGPTGILWATGYPLAASKVLRRGKQLQDAWRTRDAGGLFWENEIRHMQEGGFVPEWEWRGHNPLDQFARAIRTGNYPGAVVRLLPATVTSFMAPIMDWWIPKLKTAMYADAARFELDRLRTEMETVDATEAELSRYPKTPRERKQLDSTMREYLQRLEAVRADNLAIIRDRLGRAQESIDNRFGEVRYANWFWRRWLLDLMHVLLRAPGWQAGSYKQLLGAPIQQGRVIAGKIARRSGGGPGPGGPTPGAGAPPDGEPREPVLTMPDEDWLAPKMAYVFALVGVSMLQNGLVHYLSTGQKPEGRDWFFPKGPDGQRLRPATYISVLASAYSHPITTAVNVSAPLNALLYRLFVSNESYRSEVIREPGDPVRKQAWDMLHEVGRSYLPFAVENIQRGGGTTESLMGASLASAEFQRTPAENLLHAWGVLDRRTKSHAEAAAADASRDVRTGLAAKTPEGRQSAIAALRSGILRRGQVRAALRASSRQETYLQWGMKSLPLDRAIRLYEEMSPEERFTTRGLLEHKASLAFGAPGRPAEAAPAEIPTLRAGMVAIRKLPIARARSQAGSPAQPGAASRPAR